MRRHNHLFDQIIDRENLRLATLKALRGKRSKGDARSFVADLDANLTAMREGLRRGDFPVGVYHQFLIFDPKERQITAPCFRERVLHHAMMNVCEPVFERWLIADTFACRRGKGRNAALARSRRFSGRHAFFLKMDMRRYFDSIDHAGLLARLARAFKDRRLLDLFARVVASHEKTPGRGLPIGSLTSQYFANFYLGWFDRFVKERLRVRGYVRYMDDCALWGASSAGLGSQLDACRDFLRGELGLSLKPEPYINRTPHGIDLLGCRVFPDHIELNARSRVRFRRKLADLEREWSEGRIDEASLQRRGTALVAFTRSPGVSSRRFRARVIEQARRAVTSLRSGPPRRELEQRPARRPIGEPEQEHAGQPEQQPGVPPGPSSAGGVDAPPD